MSEISKEALADACAEKVKRLEFAVTQSAFGEVRQDLETELAIARVALMALRERAEPVAWRWGYRMSNGEMSQWRLLKVEPGKGSHPDFPRIIEPLYTVPPAPVVPEGWEPCSPEWIERNGQCSCAEAPRIAFGPIGEHYHPHLWQKSAPVVPDETFDEWSRRCEIQLTLCRPEFREVAEITWNACRAAMLAAPGKEE